MQSIVLENLSPEFISIITPRLIDLEKLGHLEFQMLQDGGQVDLIIIIQPTEFLKMIVLLWAIYSESIIPEEALEKLFNS